MTKSIDKAKNDKDSRREFMKALAYVAPAVVTLQAVPAYAKNGSSKPPKKKNLDRPRKPND